jgi:hypothetical protein
MREEERENPGLCKNCQQWLCANKDAYCGCCGAGLVSARFSADRLVFAPENSAVTLVINNQGLFRLYWAAEIISPEADLLKNFTISPDYGIIAPNHQQFVNINFLGEWPGGGELRAQLEIASNDSRRPEVRLPLALSDSEGAQ